MVAENKILTAEQEAKLRQPIDEAVGAIQAQINELRADGTDKVIDIQNSLDSLKRDKIYTAQEKETRAKELRAALEKAKAVEAQNKDKVAKLIAQSELTAEKLAAVIKEIRDPKTLAAMSQGAASLEHLNATQRVCAVIAELAAQK